MLHITIKQTNLSYHIFGALYEQLKYQNINCLI